jgi:hypothetical protein
LSLFLGVDPTEWKLANLSTILKNDDPSTLLQLYSSLGQQQIEYVPIIVDLWVTIPQDLSWARHIEKIAVKANRTLGLIKRI